MAATVVVTFLAIFRVDLNHGLSVSYRHQENYQATELLLLSRLYQSAQLPQVAPIYAQLANSSGCAAS